MVDISFRGARDGSTLTCTPKCLDLPNTQACFHRPHTPTCLTGFERTNYLFTTWPIGVFVVFSTQKGGQEIKNIPLSEIWSSSQLGEAARPEYWHASENKPWEKSYRDYHVQRFMKLCPAFTLTNTRGGLKVSQKRGCLLIFSLLVCCNYLITL